MTSAPSVANLPGMAKQRAGMNANEYMSGGFSILATGGVLGAILLGVGDAAAIVT